MKIIGELRADIIDCSHSRVRLMPSGVWGMVGPKEVDLVYRVCVDSDGCIDPDGSFDYHKNMSTDWGQDPHKGNGNGSIERHSASDVDALRRMTLEWITECTGINEVHALPGYVIDVGHMVKSREATPEPVHTVDPNGKFGIYFGLITLLANAQYAADTCGKDWPNSPNVAMSVPFCRTIAPVLDTDMAWHVAADSGILWNFLDGKSKYDISCAMLANTDKLQTIPHPDIDNVLMDNSVMVRAMDHAGFGSIICREYKVFEMLTAGEKSEIFAGIGTTLESLIKTIAAVEPSKRVLSTVWGSMFDLINILEGYLVGAGACHKSGYKDAYLEEFSEAYRAGEFAGGQIWDVGSYDGIEVLSAYAACVNRIVSNIVAHLE